MSHKSSRPIPEGLHSLTPALWFNGNCAEAIDFYKKAFGAEQVGELDLLPDGRVMHARLRINDSSIFLADAMGSETQKVQRPMQQAICTCMSKIVILFLIRQKGPVVKC